MIQSFVPDVASAATLPNRTSVIVSEPVAVMLIWNDLIKLKFVPVLVGVGIAVVPASVSMRFHLTAVVAA